MIDVVLGPEPFYCIEVERLPESGTGMKLSLSDRRGAGVFRITRSFYKVIIGVKYPYFTLILIEKVPLNDPELINAKALLF